MILKDLKLIGFGKFDNRFLKLKDGINIIYGENESGKTTIHSFIDGMFYGFLKPYVKSTIYLEEHKKYIPWNSNRYRGVIKFTINGEDYRIERTFTRNKEETKVLVENTGEDITYKINSGDKGRVLQPGIHFFGFSDGVYSNTVSIKQQGTKTEDNLANEVRDKLVNITSSLNDEISVENSIKELDKSIKEIGTLKAPTSIYGISNNTLNKLYEERKEILALKLDYEKLMDIDNNLVNKLMTLQNEIDNEKHLLKIAEYNNKKSIYNEALTISETINKLGLRIDEYISFKDLSNDDYSKGVTLKNNAKIINNKLEDTQAQANEIEDLLSNIITNKSNFDIQSFEEISKDYLSFDILEENKNNLKYKNENSSLEFLKRHYKASLNSISQIILGIGSLAILYSIAMFLTISRDTGFITLLVQLLILPIIFFILKLKKFKVLTLSIDEQIRKLNQNEKNRKQELEEIELNQRALLDKYNKESKIELRAFYENMQQNKYKRDEELKYLVENQNKLSLLKNKIRELVIEKQEIEDDFQYILLNNSMKTIEEFEIGLKNKNIFEDVHIEYSNKTELLYRILGTITLEELKHDLEQEFIDYKIEDVESKDIIQVRIDRLSEAISQIKLDKKGAEERINLLIKRVSKLVEIEEEINRNQVLLKSLDRKKAALELAKNTIENLSKDIHNQFAPEINKKVSQIVNRITGGKYSGIRIDNKLDMGVIDPVTGELINVNSLSGGTIDQLYFSLRFGIIDSITNNSLPLILDDCFIQYDDNRLSNILEFLVDISKDRQVILFSCHNRERAILESKGINFNLITLSDVIH